MPPVDQGGSRELAALMGWIAILDRIEYEHEHEHEKKH